MKTCVLSSCVLYLILFMFLSNVGSVMEYSLRGGLGIEICSSTCSFERGGIEQSIYCSNFHRVVMYLRSFNVEDACATNVSRIPVNFSCELRGGTERQRRRLIWSMVNHDPSFL